MPRLNKVFFNKGVHLITTSVEEGIMFPPNALINEALMKCLAQAQKLHPIHISHIMFNTTHVHFIMGVINPQDASDFMERFKTESAHIINRLLGREKRTLWCEGYDSPLIDDIETLKKKIAYLYANAAKDGLLDNIDEYPGVCSWKQFVAHQSGDSSVKRYETYEFSRSDFTQLPNRPMKEQDYIRLRNELIEVQKKKKEVKKTFYTIDNNHWMQRFGITDPKEQHKINQEIINDVRYQEEQYRQERKKTNTPPMGYKKIVQTAVGFIFIPARKGKRMLVHSVDKIFRAMQIAWLKELIAEGKAVLKAWQKGDLTVPYPPGLFPPTGFRQIEPIGW